ncbi:MAG TPA: hypothetical protein PLO37_26135 [Candidatus Hydrogenedentes bacterium]|mgnify:CR=1 FL=1|nr:hypothetical protein [Hyphomonadaceae bacterium]HPG70335.1 hypothetical protein [Candidatus Hydrogenedentota bacterium]
MKPDPIIAEVYRAKEQFAREIENDVGKLFERLREAAKKHPERMVTPPLEPNTEDTPRNTKGKTAK